MDIYLIMVVVLFALAIADLIIGVSNDAVNFLNSAIGSKVAAFKTIMIVAALGIVIGATFSSGMMEVARKGIMNPQHFFFSEIMLIFLAVMITDIILLDTFNTLGMPTSTTVSIVFELLGASVSIAMFKILANGGEMATYINSATALKIISGILLSVIVSFVLGAAAMYVSRLAFSFNYEKRIKYLSAIWGGIAITAITYFIVIKGLKGSTFADYPMTLGLESGAEPVILKQWVQDMAFPIIGFSFIGWTILLQVLYIIFRIDILKLTVLVGTFALAMAFAGNDLVNFIGVPLAGYAAYTDFIAHPGMDPGNLLMESLTGKSVAPASFLIMAGLIMVVTLWTSKKARNVIKTSLDLSRQDEGNEKFGASPIARSMVRASISGSETMSKFVPTIVKDAFSRQFDQTKSREKYDAMGADAPAFDMVRASVNLVMASIIISMATSQKLPLSTTYVTFMVAMGTSLADKAWGRESAVFRITGVLSVILGWFFTALIAFTAAFVVAAILHYLGIFGVALMVAVAIFILYKTQILQNKNLAAGDSVDNKRASIEEVGVVISMNESVVDSLAKMKSEMSNVLAALNNEDRRSLKSANESIMVINKDAKALKKGMHSTISKLRMETEDSGLYYVQVLDYLREMAHSLEFISQPAYEHVLNNHKKMTDEQKNDLNELNSKMRLLIDRVTHAISNNNFEELDHIIAEQQQSVDFIKDIRKRQVKRIKKGNASTKASLLYFTIVHEYHNILLQMVNLLKSQRDFITKK
ncbi:MAG: phosphate permease [Bacteroidetes bacterium]|nr:MAG: phosphate permease [Bacteroidota bacterium]